MSTALALARCSHPAPTVAVTLFTLAMALGVAGNARAALITAAVAAGQLSVGWSNDWLDRARDRRVGRRDKPLVTGAVTDATVGGGAVAALAACAVLSLATGALAGAVHLLAVAFAWSYNLWLKATPASPLPYAAAFALLPAFITLAGPGRAVAPGWALVAGGLLGAGAHFTNTLADFREDAATGVRGLPHRLG
ncbi:MAG: UbiA family prenyltransferase, partial [Actinomycetota bacterium]|nr:UbiA family prenyltransferase [Actinomycetota bacterium]